ncbi:uncharacterized protein LOC115701172 isoform X5 [Cannabis sativa]|uniref:uncharacterized protein LOC115701172 isoform X5 n=1 Tax=Cannabis sativa TaxID=3483 RepID=UPI0029C9CB21|nr:uncharacterized protein LOC115701172 isoform X5 [Cannabis sativa]
MTFYHSLLLLFRKILALPSHYYTFSLFILKLQINSIQFLFFLSLHKSLALFLSLSVTFFQSYLGFRFLYFQIWDSQTRAPSQISDEEGRVSTRASSILQMWRELEDEHVVSRAQERFRDRLFQQRGDGFIADLSRTDSSESHGSDRIGDSEVASLGENDHEVLSNYNSEHSSDFGEVERVRVRQVFRGWMNSGAGECVSNVSQISNSPRAQWLGENEQERVRVIREWVQTNSQLRGTRAGSRENQPAESGTQIEQVRDGLVVNQNEGRHHQVRRGIRKLCGRQALLDMVKKAERERKMELQVLLDHRAVTNFPHRNRIQSLLRGWFLRNGSLVENERPSSVAESELGLLRQRHTVSGLREGFSRLDNSVCAQASSSLSDTSNEDTSSTRNGEPQENNLFEVRGDICEQSELNYEGSEDQEHDGHGILDGQSELRGNAVEDIDSQESNDHIIEEWHEQVPDNVENATNEWASDTLHIGVEERRNILEASYSANDESESRRESNDYPHLSGPADDLEDNTVAHMIGEESASEVEQWQDQSPANEEGDWEQVDGEYDEWTDNPGENIEESQQQTTEFGWSQGNEDVQNSHLEEVPEEWHEEGDFQETAHSWLEEPSDSETVPARQVETYYFPDDDNVYSIELRELLGRRRVSNLLHSGFRESLDQLIQSYVERQSHAAVDWELDGSSPSPASVEQDLDQARANQSEAQEDATVVRPPPPVAPSTRPIPPPPPPMWDQRPHRDTFTQHEMHQRFGIVCEWEIINDMRIDMARLQQRMNNLQRMMETCMDMQLELQRSIRQEVSAALNRPAASQAVLCEDESGLAMDDTKWDHVRKGMCCICSNTNIDSLLYRCGHMCTCSKCANELVESKGKCPMCRAPVVEVIRAYSIL